MKNLLLLILLITLIPPSIQAQNTFAPIGTEWWYGGNNFDYLFYPEGGNPSSNCTWVDHVQSLSDTIVAGQNCRRLNIKRMQKNATAPDSVFIFSEEDLFVYDNTDTVFVYNNLAAQFLPLYVFNSQVGDTVILPIRANPIQTFSYVVDSIIMEVYDTTHLKSYYTHVLDTVSTNVSLNWGIARYNPTTNSWTNNGKFTEKLGGNYKDVIGFFPAYTFHNPDGAVSIEFPSGNLRCYTEPGLSIKMADISCDSILMPNQIVGIPELDKTNEHITIFPNPATNKLNIEVKGSSYVPISVKIINISGKEIISSLPLKPNIKTHIDIINWPAGIYLMMAESEGKRYYERISVCH